MSTYCIHCGHIIIDGDPEFCGPCRESSPYPIFLDTVNEPAAIEWMHRFIENNGGFDEDVEPVDCDAVSLNSALSRFRIFGNASANGITVQRLAAMFLGFCQWKGIEL